MNARIAGNVGKAAELKRVGDGQVLEFSVAENDRVKVNGQWEDKTVWVSVSIWGKRGESLSRVIDKGTFVIVDGKLSIRDYTDRDGAARYSVELRANDVQLGPKRNNGAQHHERRAEDVTGPPAGWSANNDDIPF